MERVTLESQHPEKPVEIWAEETRYYWVHRRVWAKRGERDSPRVSGIVALWFRFCPSTDR